MRVRILGAAAGGGLPQWNCRCANCEAARAGSAQVRPRTQSSVAVSADGRAWFLLNVSPDVRQQILAFPPLGPPSGQRRGSSIAGCVLTDAELDHTAGLLLLREGGGYGIVSTPLVRRWLSRHLSVNTILAERAWLDLPLDGPLELPLADSKSSGLRVRAFEVDRHVPRFIAEDTASAVGSVVGLHIEDANTGGKLVYVPCLARVSDRLRAETQGADALLLDGTFWSEDEPIRLGIGSRTAPEMGHLPVSGLQGSLAWLAELPVRHRVYVHINNTNPMLDERGPEWAMVHDGGVTVAADGDSFDL
jgi:pyrroloquinoline quinone biosynthesis protein B